VYFFFSFSKILDRYTNPISENEEAFNYFDLCVASLEGDQNFNFPSVYAKLFYQRSWPFRWTIDSCKDDGML
jgi:hypothetical protein